MRAKSSGLEQFGDIISMKANPVLYRFSHPK